jgi:hypothetical protein
VSGVGAAAGAAPQPLRRSSPSKAAITKRVFIVLLF